MVLPNWEREFFPIDNLVGEECLSSSMCMCMCMCICMRMCMCIRRRNQHFQSDGLFLGCNWLKGGLLWHDPSKVTFRSSIGSTTWCKG